MRDQRTCTKCGETKGLDEFYRRKGGRIVRECKECMKARSRKWYAENAERHRERQSRYDREHAERLREAARAWKARNREHVREWNRRWRDGRRELERERQRAWVEANPEKRREAALRYARANPEVANGWKLRNPEVERERKRRAEANRRALKRGVEFEDIDPALVRARDGSTCHLCGEAIPPGVRWPDLDSFSVDHVIPLAKGGSHTYENVRSAHLGCNISKGAQMPEGLAL